ncbi:FAD-dependent oxidoreductase [Longimicrobium sp.]|uniref:FAD-dependent oxidoreductase n=1 Tax=Longimicrobium sp. TaxID=2029185 RepID=UPI002BC65CB8|nr:FAD-dependent oxidoreductase [Longimicrobium sp.]HSU15178.1 FAD-dependent oxidoreductase [Longimicrobium sp.]
MEMGGGRDALVIGAGVIGLTSAIRLQEAGWRVRVWAAEPPERTTSAVAAAIWYPYRAGPQALVKAWGERSFAVFEQLVADAETGVRMLPGIELLPRKTDPRQFPEWAAHIAGFRVADAAEVPDGRVGWSLTVPVADTGVFLRWLAARFAANGGEMEMRRIASLDEAAAYPLVVNCSGLGARELAGDAAMRPIRGQVMRVENPGLTRFWLDEYHPEGMLYIIPRGGDCILGGTADEGEEDTTPDFDVSEAIRWRCAELEPDLADARLLEHRVGLRPWRPEIRLALETLPGGGRVIHNYGHGGAGVTLSWGCAEEVVALAETI